MKSIITKINNSSNKLIFIVFSLTLISSILTFQLSKIPFGWQFTSSVVISDILIIVFFLLVFLKLFLSKKRWIKMISSIPLLISIIILTTSIFLTNSYQLIAHSGFVKELNKNDWKKDLSYITKKYKTEYPKLYNQVDSLAFENKIHQVEKYIESGSENQILMSIFDLHASLNDAHSIPLFFAPAYDLHFYPIRIYPFKEGWFVTDAGRNYKNIIGSQLTKINNTPIEKIFEEYNGAFSYESEAGKIDRFRMWGLMSEWLYFKGFISNINKAEFTFKDKNGNEFIETVPVIRALNMMYWTSLKKLDNNTITLFENTRNDYYWFEYNQDKANLYVQFNKVENQKGKQSIAEFSKQLETIVSNNKINKFILDLRINGGGDDSYLTPLFHLIKDHKAINQYGKLFVLINRPTFSSAALFAWKLQMQTEAIFVGMPSSQGVSFNANPQFITLPNSKFIFTLSKTSTNRNQPNWIFKPDNSIYPDKQIRFSIQDFIKHSDPVIDYVNQYKEDDSNNPFIDSSLRKTLTGRYKLSDFHELKIISQNDSLKMIINDFVDGSLYRVEKNLIYNKENDVFTDQNRLYTIKLINETTISLTYKNQSVLASKDSSIISAFEAFKYNEIEKGIELIKANQEKYIESNTQLENILVLLGYKYLNQDSTEKSLLIFKTATELFPKSWNTFDSYAEALAKNGQIELSISNYEKSVQLNPDNNNGKEMIQKLTTQKE